MKNLIKFSVTVIILALAACGKKENQGKLVYSLTYELPDSLKSYIYYLPKEAVVYFKGDSAVTIQQMGDESTTIITDKKTGYMHALLKSPEKKYSINYNKNDQEEERANMPIFTAAKGKTTKVIAGQQAQQYTLTDKMTAQSHEAWFTTSFTMPQNAMSVMFDSSLGVPLNFSTNQNGIITHTTIKEIKLDDMPPAGIFSIPKDYQTLTPQQLKEMPVSN